MQFINTQKYKLKQNFHKTKYPCYLQYTDLSFADLSYPTNSIKTFLQP